MILPIAHNFSYKNLSTLSVQTNTPQKKPLSISQTCLFLSLCDTMSSHLYSASSHPCTVCIKFPTTCMELTIFPEHVRKVLMWKSTTTPTKYYVVFRGLLPGIYENPAEVLKNICNIENTHVLRFTDPNAAGMAWRRQLKAHTVVPLGAFYQPPPPSSPNAVQNQLPINTDYPDPPVPEDDDDSLSFTLTDVSTDIDDEAGGAWVVYKGRLPGIFDTW